MFNCERYSGAMIQIMNKFSMSWVAKGLLFLLVASFVVWGVTDWLGSRMQKDTVAQVGGDSISKHMLYRATRMRMSQLPQEAKEGIQKQPELTRILAYQALQTLIRESSLKQELNRLGVYVSDDFLKEVVFSRPEFQDAKGQFSKAKFDALLARNGLSERAFLSYEKDHLRSLFLQRAIALKETGVPDAVLKPLKKQLREERSVALVTIPAHIFPVVAVPSEADIKGYYEDNPGSFSLPEARDLSIVLLTEQESDQKVRNQEEKEAAHDALYEKARLIQDRLAEGQTLASIAKEMHLKYGSIEGVTLEGTDQNGEPVEDSSGFFTPKVIEHAFEFGEGNESDLTLLNGNTYYIVVVDKIIPSVVLSFEAAKEKVIKRLQDMDRIKKAQQLAAKIVEQVKAGGNLKAIAQKMHLSFQIVPRVTLFGKNLVLPPEGLVSAFSLPLGGVGWVLGANKEMYVLQVNGLCPDAIPESDQDYKKAVARLEVDFRSDLENGYVESLEEELGVTINDKAFQEVVDAF